ncbi:hypothetical protein G9C98_007672 [Cotesia typhae]|uniref:Sm domain-containing protein n=1 Tax=Cotesia typhae TaxID=2053667 RepID=A0A8J5QYK4_9HYME|nr:hypothetical protein G9C98_007672 [Cotesia typhae]
MTLHRLYGLVGLEGHLVHTDACLPAASSHYEIYTRSARGVRGFIEAYVAAFDKHWNLALEDCYEEWTRKVKRKAPILGIPSVKSEEANENVPKMIVKTSNGKTETLKRHVPQMMLRGEQVVMITVRWESEGLGWAGNGESQGLVPNRVRRPTGPEDRSHGQTKPMP